MRIVAGICAVLGHNFTCWLKFKGGKGIATSAGVYFALAPLAAGIALGTWIIVFALGRYVSVASIAAAVALPAAVWLTKRQPVFGNRHHRAGTARHLQTQGQHPAPAQWHRAAFGSKIRDTGGNQMKITVLGAGAWGTALAKVLHENGNAVTLWDIDTVTLDELRRGRNERYLPGVALPTDWKVEADFARAVAGAECLALAIPSQSFRQVAVKLKGHPAIMVSVTKGIEFETGETMSRILREQAPANRVAALSGPSFAREVALGIPTTVVCASESDGTARTVQGLFHRPRFRIYRSTDILGVEYGGALKNIIAIAAGVSDGLGYGDNTKAGLVTRALSEIRRLGVACGAQPETFAGLSGLGDLMLTCFSKQSRNRDLGERLGRGETMAAIQASHPKLAEGYPTARSAHRLAREKKVLTPIMDEVYALLYEGKEPKQAVQDLISRAFKAED